jgi:transcriptional regulator with XRE-family HTH domain
MHTASRRPRRKPIEPAAGTPAAQARARASSADLGRVARRIRDSQGLTLADVASRAGISAAMLSRLETGRTSPSLETIVSLAQALGVKASHLLQDIGVEDESAQVVHAGQGLEVIRRGTKRGHTYHLLAAQRGPRKVFEPFLVTLTDKSEVFPGFEHPGTEFLHILSGEIVYRLGHRSYHLKPGDSLTFQGGVAHGPEKLVKVPIRMLSIIMYADGEKHP